MFGAVRPCWPVAARAQTPSKVPHIGIVDFFSSAASADFINPFQEGLRALGYQDGQNVRVEYHSAEQRSDRAADLVANFVRQNVDLIVAIATPAAHAAKQATTSIPIVMNVANPLATGLVANLARPGGNLTGISTTSTDLAGKRLELLRELRPGATRIAFLGAASHQCEDRQSARGGKKNGDPEDSVVTKLSIWRGELISSQPPARTFVALLLCK